MVDEFNMCDARTGKTIDIVVRQLIITQHFWYSKEAKNNVKISIDMYSYISLIKTTFPNASIIIDKFHIVQLISRSLNKTRVRS